MTDKDASRNSGATELAEFLSQAYSCAMTMFENASYIEKELVNVELPQNLRDEVAEVCATWISNKHDIMTELEEFHDVPAHPDEVRIERRATRITTWLSEDFPQLNALVEKLRNLSEQDPKIVLAYMLVAGSAVNVLRSFAAVRAASDRYFVAVAE